MANKQMGGYGLSVSNVSGEEVKNSPIQSARQKTEELINANPDGVTITKLSDSTNKQLTEYLTAKKLEIAEFEKIKALGSGAEGYDEAVSGVNNIEKEIVQLNNDFEQAAGKRKELLDMQVSGAYAMSNTNEQAYNFHNFANGTYGERAQIVDGRLLYNGGLLDEVNVGGSYSYELEDLVEETFSETRELAYGNEPVDVNEYNNVYRKNLEKDLSKLIRGPEGGFVETVLGMHDYILFESKESEKIEPELTAEEIIKKFS